MSESLYRLLLRLYPRRFRDEYGPEMLQLFRDRMQTERGLAGIRLWFDVLADLAISIPREHRRPAGVFRVHPLVEAFRGSLKMVLGFVLMSELALWGGASQAWVTGILFLCFDWAFLKLLHGRRTPAWEYSLDSEGIEVRGGYAKAARIRRGEVAQIVQFGGDLIVRGSNGAQIPVYSFVTGYPAIRAQLAAWAPIEVVPSNLVPGEIVALAFLATLLMRNPWAVVVLGLAVGALVVDSARRPSQHPQMPVAWCWRRWIFPGIALAVLAVKVCITLSSL